MGTINVVYLGPDAVGVEIADTGQFAHTGQPVAVDSEVAERLLQTDSFARSTTKAAGEAAKRAKRTPTPDTLPDGTSPENEE